MAAIINIWNDAEAPWSRYAYLGLEAALREAGCSKETIDEIVVLVNATHFDLDRLNSLTDPESARALVLCALGRDSSPIERVYSGSNVRIMNEMEAIALCVNLTSNTKISYLELKYLGVFGTGKGCELLGSALATNSSVKALHISLADIQSDGVRLLLHGLEANITLERLNLETNPLQEDGILRVAELLSNNKTIKVFSVNYFNCSFEGARAMSSALVRNKTLETLSLEVGAVGSAIMVKLLQPLSGGDARAVSSLKELNLFGVDRECAKPVSDMIRMNGSLKRFGLSSSRTVTGQRWSTPYRPPDWKDHIFPALQENDTLKEVDLHGCDGLNEEVYASLMDVLQKSKSKTRLEQITVSGTDLESRQGQIDEELRMNSEYRYALKGQQQIPTTSGRVVLFGYEHAGKTLLAKTMKRIDHGTSYVGKAGHSVKTFVKKQWQSTPRIQEALLGKDAHKELSHRTTGFEVVVLSNQTHVKSIWDFAGENAYYACHDCIFPQFKNSYFLYVCSSLRPPDESDSKAKEKDRDAIKDECEYWMRFIATNTKRDGRGQRSELPRVRFVLTKTDTLDSPNDIISNAQAVVRELKKEFSNVLDLWEKVDVVDAHSLKDVEPLLHACNDNLADILADQKEYEVCQNVRHLLKGWSKQNRRKPVLSLEEFHKLCAQEISVRQSKTGEWNFALAYLKDLGEVIFLTELDLIVTDPSWFGTHVLGSLIDVSRGHHRRTLLPRPDRRKPIHHDGYVQREDMQAYLGRSLQEVDLGKCISAGKLIDLMINLGMCFEGAGEANSLFVPALFDDKDDTASKAKRKLEWQDVDQKECECFGLRLECNERSTTFLRPGLFAKLQAHLWKYINSEWEKNSSFAVGRNLISFAHSGVEVHVEYAGDIDDSIDILVRSSTPFSRTLEFVEKHVVETICTFCASPQGCQELVLVLSVIRPACVKNLKPCRERKGHSVLVSVLKDRVREDPDYIHRWRRIIPSESNSDVGHDLLKGKGSYEKGKSQVPEQDSSSTAPGSASSSSNELPKFLYATIEDVNILDRLNAKCNFQKKIPVKLHLLCEHKDGPHRVKNQPGRIVTLKANDATDVPILKVGIVLLWAAMGVGASILGASLAMSQVDRWIQSLLTTTDMPGFTAQLVQELVNPRDLPGRVSKKKLVEMLDRYLKVDPKSEGVKQILDLGNLKKFSDDFKLRKVRYTEATYENMIGWVCDKHFTEGFHQRILESVLH